MRSRPPLPARIGQRSGRSRATQTRRMSSRHPDTALRRYIVWQREGSYFRSLDLIARELENLMWHRA